MKMRSVLAIILFTCWFGAVPAFAHDCCHHHCNYGNNNDCNHDCNHNVQGNRHCCPWAPTGGPTDLRTSERKITEVDYLPGATADSGMVEVRLQSAGQSELIRLAPVGFLKQGGLLLREGDTISVKGFTVAGMEGDVLVATELHKGDKTLPLRDAWGRSVW
jgi:hypothetical protein